MKAVPKNSLIDFMEVEYSTKVQEEIIAWGKGHIGKGPDGGVFVNTNNGTERGTYAPTGKFICDNGCGDFVILSDKEFKSEYRTVVELGGDMMSPEEIAGMNLWSLMDYSNPKTPTWDSLNPIYRASWIALANKVSPK